MTVTRKIYQMAITELGEAERGVSVLCAGPRCEDSMVSF
jgi:hypothetical protein